MDYSIFFENGVNNESIQNACDSAIKLLERKRKYRYIKESLMEMAFTKGIVISNSLQEEKNIRCSINPISNYPIHLIDPSDKMLKYII